MKDQQILHYEYNTSSIDELKVQLLKKTKQYGDFSFDEDKWYCSNKHKDARRAHTFTIYFHYVQQEYRELLKYYALLKKLSIESINLNIRSVAYFLDYYKENYPYLQLKDVNPTIISNFQLHLKEQKTHSMCKRFYGGIKDFFETMYSFTETPDIVPTRRKNPFLTKPKRNPNKYIPEEVVFQLDAVMKDERHTIPIELRTTYWLLRSFPNRGTEIMSLKQDCLKTEYSRYVIFIPTWKQNGGYDRPKLKAIPIIYADHGKYLIELVQRQIKEAKRKLSSNPEVSKAKSDYLLISNGFSLEKGKDGYLTTKVYRQFENKNTLLTRDKFNKILTQIIMCLGIKDKDGKSIRITSHQFRHNAVTDRLYLGKFTLEQVAVQSGHKSITMLEQYHHPLKEVYQKILTEKLVHPAKAPVQFKGKYANLDMKTIKMLEKQPDAYLTWEADGQKGVGVCSQINDCNPDGTPHYFECYACNWFVPKAEYYDRYKRELLHWETKVRDTADNPKKAAIFENAVRNVCYVERIISICDYGIEKYKAELTEKILNGEITD